jgi:hypothetical protein
MWNNNSKSEYSNHILNTGHTYEARMDIIDIIKIGEKGKHLNTLEKYHIYATSKHKLHMNDTYFNTYNSIVKILHKFYTR